MKNKIAILAEIAIFAAIGYVLDLLAGAYSNFFPNGGSIGIALLCVVIVTYRRGMIPGLITGLLIGSLDLLDGFYAISDEWWKVFLQIGFDYLFAYTLVALCGVIKPLSNKYNSKLNFALTVTLATLIGGLLKYLSHFLSGVFFWPEYPNQDTMGRVIYSLSYNGAYMIPTILVSSLVAFFVAYRAPMIFNKVNVEFLEVKKEEKRVSVLGISSTLVGTIGLVLSIFGLVKAMAFSGEYFDPNYMQYPENDFEELLLGHGALFIILILISLVILGYGLYKFIKEYKGYRVSINSFLIAIATISSLVIIEGINYILTYSYKVFIKGKNPVEKGYDPTWPYAFSLILGVIVLILVIILMVKKKNNKENTEVLN